MPPDMGNGSGGNPGLPFRRPCRDTGGVFREAAGSPRGYRYPDHAPLPGNAGGGDHLPGLLAGDAGAGKILGRGTCPRALSAGGCGGAALWGRQLRHRTLTQRLSCVPGQGGRLAGDLSCTAARRSFLRLLLCAGTKPPHGLANPQAVCAKGLVHPAL